jgi:hypothetical protein
MNQTGSSKQPEIGLMSALTAEDFSAKIAISNNCTPGLEIRKLYGYCADSVRI